MQVMCHPPAVRCAGRRPLEAHNPRTFAEGVSHVLRLHVREDLVRWFRAPAHDVPLFTEMPEAEGVADLMGQIEAEPEVVPHRELAVRLQERPDRARVGADRRVPAPTAAEVLGEPAVLERNADPARRGAEPVEARPICSGQKLPAERVAGCAADHTRGVLRELVTVRDGVGSVLVKTLD